jgi:eukaryotic-like serine/threonine-protein kinase
MNNILTDQSIVSNRYQIVRSIGRGGMGAVYETIDLRLQTTVALKQRTTVDDTFRDAFEREARMLAKLRHPGLPIVSDHFFDGEDQFLVMEYVAGPSLEDVLANQKGPLDEAETLRIADQLLEILEYLHAYSPPIIHRDIKPQNIKISGESRRVVLLDFGLAKGSAAVNSPTLVKSIFGYTRSYAPPEQVNNTGTDQRTDVYSLGATLYHMLTGEAPASSEMRMFAAVNEQSDPLKAPTELNPRLSRDVSTICVTALALSQAQRYQSAHMMRTALRLTTLGKRLWPTTSTTELIQPPPIQPTFQVPPPSTELLQTPPAQDQSRRTLVIIAIAVIALVALIGAGAAFVLMRGPTNPTNVPLSLTAALPTDAPPTRTSIPSATSLPPTHTPVPSATPLPPTHTPVPSATPLPPTHTPVPSAMPLPPTYTPVPPPPRPTPKPQKPTPKPKPPRPSEPPPPDNGDPIPPTIAP